MKENQSKESKTCTYCNRKLVSKDDIELGHHLACENPLEQLEINRYWDICCDRDPNFSMVTTTLEEFSKLTQKVDENTTALLNYKKTVKDKSNKYDLLIEFAKNQENVLKPELKKMPYLIFYVDFPVFLDPFNIERLCQLLNIDIKAEDIYGKEKLAEIKKQFRPQIEKKELIGIAGNLSDYPLLPQQNILKYRIHYVSYDSVPDNVLLISEKPIDHITATFLFAYHRQYLSMLEVGFEQYYDRILVHDYRHSINYYLQNKEYVANQRKLIQKYKS